MVAIQALNNKQIKSKGQINFRNKLFPMTLSLKDSDYELFQLPVCANHRILYDIICGGSERGRARARTQKNAKQRRGLLTKGEWCTVMWLNGKEETWGMSLRVR